MKNQLIVCPECGVPKSNIKRYRLFDRFIGMVVAAQYESSIHTCCSDCMRSTIIKKTFGWIILNANLFWVVLILPWHTAAYLLSFLEGHSPLVKKHLE